MPVKNKDTVRKTEHMLRRVVVMTSYNVLLGKSNGLGIQHDLTYIVYILNKSEHATLQYFI